ncbi:hypothetical protein KY314_03145 [Candidatus Woesearchaeota archaeon]|nr:hypothetical protein [Candidatus Woesearchaeota archaeon]
MPGQGVSGAKGLSVEDLARIGIVMKLGMNTTEWEAGAKKAANASDKASEKTIQGFKAVANEGIKSVKTAYQKLKHTLTSRLPLGLSISLPLLMREAHNLNMEWAAHRESLKDLSDSMGDASKAVGMMTSLWGKTGLSLSALKGVMNAINAQGIPVMTAGFENLAAVISNVHQASGIAVETLAEFTAGMKDLWGVSFKASTAALDSVLALQDAFNLTNRQMEQVIKTTSQAMNRMGMFLENSDEGLKAMTRGIGGAVGAMNKFGVSVQKSTDFFNKIMDPENLNENLGLFARLGISYEETMEMMTSAKGQELFFEKLMNNLPTLARQIEQLRNPMAKLQFAKSLGLPLEIAQKMAKATRGEIEQLMEEHKIEIEEGKKIEKKQARMQAETARFNEALHFMKMKALMPLMQFMNTFVPKLMGILSKFAGVFSKLMEKIIVPALTSFTNVMVPAINRLLDGDAKGFFKTLWGGAGDVIKEWTPKLLKGIWTVLKSAVGFVITGIKELWKSGPMGKVLTGLGLTFAGGKLMGFVKNFWRAFKGPRGSKPSRPMYVSDVGMTKGGLLSKALNFFKGKGKVGGVLSGAKLLMKGGFAEGAGVSGAGMLKAGAGKLPTGALGKLGTKIFPALGKMSGKLVTGLGAFTKVGMKAVPVIGQIVSALLGAYEGASAATAHKLETEGREATTVEKTGAGIAGAATLGIGPLIDKIFGTTITQKMGDHMKKFSESMLGYFHPIGLVMKGIAIFQDKAMSAELVREEQRIEQKMKMGEDLTAKDIAMQKKLEQERLKGYTTVSQGFRNIIDSIVKPIKGFIDSIGKTIDDIREAWNKFGLLGALKKAWEKIKSIPGDLWKAFKRQFKRFSAWLDLKIGLPAFKAFGGIGIFIEQMANKILLKIAGIPKIGEWVFGEGAETALKKRGEWLNEKERVFAKFKTAKAGTGTMSRLARDRTFKDIAYWAGLQNKAWADERAERRRERAERLANERKAQKTRETIAGYGAQTAKNTMPKETKKATTAKDYLDFWFNNRSYLKIRGATY